MLAARDVGMPDYENKLAAVDQDSYRWWHLGFGKRELADALNKAVASGEVSADGARRVVSDLHLDPAMVAAR